MTLEELIKELQKINDPEALVAVRGSWEFSETFSVSQNLITGKILIDAGDTEYDSEPFNYEM